MELKTSLERLSAKYSSRDVLNACIALLGFTTILGIIVTLTGRTGGDQEAFMYAASRLLAGARPGMDLWEVKPPVHVYFLALGQWLFGGPSYLSTLTVDVILQICGAAVLTAGLTRRFGWRNGLLAALVYLADYYIVVSYWTRAQVEATANALMMASLGLLIMNNIYLWFLAGVLFATAGATKGITFLFIVPFLALIIALSSSSRLRKVISFSAGLGVGLLAWFALWASSGSLLGVLYDIQDVTVFQNSGNIEIWTALYSSLRYVLTSVMWPTLLGLAFLLFVDWKTALHISLRSIILAGLFLGSWLVIATVVVAIQGQYFAYHYLHFVLGGALFTGLSVFLQRCYPTRITWKRCGIGLGLFSLLVGTAIAIPNFRIEFRNTALLNETAHHIYWLAEEMMGRISREEYIQLIALRSTYDENELVKTSVAVSNYSKPGDKVLYLESGKIAWRDNRESSSRYFIPLPVQRVLSGRSPRSASTSAYKDLYNEIWNYDGPVIVMEIGWFPLKNDPVLYERIFSRYKVIEHNPSSTEFGGHDVLVPKTLK